MNPRLHFLICLAGAAAGFGGAAALALNGSTLAVCILAALAYALAGVGRFFGIMTNDAYLGADAGRAALFALVWPLFDLWLIAWVLLPSPRPSAPSGGGDSGAPGRVGVSGAGRVGLSP